MGLACIEKALLMLCYVPSEVMGLHLNPCELNTVVKWWLGLNPHSGNDSPQTCPLCPECHHSVTCKCRGGGGEDVTNCHNLLRNAVYEACRQASLSVCLEAGGGLGKDKALTRPADVLVSNPSGSASAAYLLSHCLICQL